MHEWYTSVAQARCIINSSVPVPLALTDQTWAQYKHVSFAHVYMESTLPFWWCYCTLIVGNENGQTVEWTARILPYVRMMPTSSDFSVSCIFLTFFVCYVHIFTPSLVDPTDEADHRNQLIHRWQQRSLAASTQDVTNCFDVSLSQFFDGKQWVVTCLCWLSTSLID